MAAVTNAVDQEAGRSDKLTLLPLVALVVGSMIGGGAFNLPSDMSHHASPGAIIIGWVITGTLRMSDQIFLRPRQSASVTHT